MNRPVVGGAVWGAHLDDGGGATFRLWAPGLDSLTLRLEGHGERDMHREQDGWFGLSVEDARPGQAYAFVLPDGLAVPDPAARAQATDVHGPSRLVDPHSYRWKTADWRGRPWQEAAIYELHVGTFSPEGTFDGAIQRLDYLADLGITAIELMPVAQFSGTRGWGYDGVLPYCPHGAYGGVEGLKRLVDAAHARGLMVLLDVVYNHFGPDGNYLGLYAPGFFDDSRHTPWGPAIRYHEPAVRAFFVANPLYWIDEFRIDGLRFDAIDQIFDASPKHILEEMAEAARARFPDREIHLTTEDERNIVGLHPHDEAGRPRLFTAEWNDDVHHAAHCIATGESGGYYAGFADDPVGHLMRALAEGFVYQGEPYAPWEGKARGEASAGQPPSAFVAFLQNHDQIGNRAFGERLSTLADAETIDLLTPVLILNPQIPLIFMGEEYGETRPFLYFTDFHGELASAVREGRRREFAAFAEFSDHAAGRIPDPNAPETFLACALDWASSETSEGSRRLALMRALLGLRHSFVTPRLPGLAAMNATARRLGGSAFEVAWTLKDEARLGLWTNLGAADAPGGPLPDGFTPIYESRAGLAGALDEGLLPARSVIVAIADRRAPSHG